jgi:hypothetical protein
MNTEANGTWRKATYSNGSGDCVEVGRGASAVLVRDTTSRDGGTAGRWRSALARGRRSWRRSVNGHTPLPHPGHQVTNTGADRSMIVKTY